MRRFICWILGHKWEVHYQQAHLRVMPLQFPYVACSRCDSLGAP